MSSLSQITRLLALPIAMAIFMLAAQSAGDLAWRSDVPLQTRVAQAR